MSLAALTKVFRIITIQHKRTNIMKLKLFAGLVIAATALIACDDTTDTLGNSLTNNTDQFDILTDTFNVTTKSITVDSVLSRSQYSYLGHIKDTETGTYVTSNYTTQFAILERMDESTSTLFPKEDSIRSIEDGKVVADSCKMRIYFYSSIGDSLNPMKLSINELAKPVDEGIAYYSNFDPEAEGYLRNDGHEIKKNKVYTTLDLNLSDSLRGKVVDKTNMENVTIPLNDKYTDVDGKEYKNYGTFLLRKYYEHPEYFDNSYSFIHNVCPGFYVKSTNGLGVMSEVYMTEISLYYRFESNDTLYNGACVLSGTEEVMQTTRVVNDKQTMKALADDNSCTYLKTPAGIFTEVTLPIDEIISGHESDTISSAKIVFTRYNSKDSESYITAPQNVLLLPKDSLFSFFENKNLSDNKTSYLCSLNESYNTYTYNNISNLVTAMANAKKNGTASADWNKAVLVPVTLATSTSSSSTTSTVIGVSNNMSLTSTRLVGGSANQHSPITISIIYNKFKKD